jgi:hypothetical protein
MNESETEKNRENREGQKKKIDQGTISHVSGGNDLTGPAEKEYTTRFG